MDKKRTYFPITTAQQRRLLFETWEKTGDLEEACRRAHVSVGTFYYWKPRFAEGGYEALEKLRSRAPKAHAQTDPAIAARVVKMREAQPTWGKRRIADELARGNSWVPLVSPNTVKRILQDAGLWHPDQRRAKKGGPKTAPAQPKPQDNP